MKLLLESGPVFVDGFSSNYSDIKFICFIFLITPLSSVV